MRTRLLAMGSAAVLLAAAPLAQGPAAPGAPPSAGVVIKGRAPVSDETLRVKLPRPREVDLPNGLHLMVLEDRRTPQVTFSMTIPGAGGYVDPDALPGLASFTAALMREARRRGRRCSCRNSSRPWPRR